MLPLVPSVPPYSYSCPPCYLLSFSYSRERLRRRLCSCRIPPETCMCIYACILRLKCCVHLRILRIEYGYSDRIYIGSKREKNYNHKVSYVIYVGRRELCFDRAGLSAWATLRLLSGYLFKIPFSIASIFL